jgi:hypothetical protein
MTTHNSGRESSAKRASACRELAVFPAVEEINEQPDREPGEESQPGNYGQSHHQSAAKDDRKQRKPRNKRNAEAARTVGLAAAKDGNAHRDQNEGEQRTDVRQIGGGADVHEPRRYSHCEAGNPGGPVRRFEFGVNGGEQFWQQPVA